MAPDDVELTSIPVSPPVILSPSTVIPPTCPTTSKPVLEPLPVMLRLLNTPTVASPRSPPTVTPVSEPEI